MLEKITQFIKNWERVLGDAAKIDVESITETRDGCEVVLKEAGGWEKKKVLLVIEKDEEKWILREMRREIVYVTVVWRLEEGWDIEIPLPPQQRAEVASALSLFLATNFRSCLKVLHPHAAHASLLDWIDLMEHHISWHTSLIIEQNAKCSPINTISISCESNGGAKLEAYTFVTATTPKITIILGVNYHHPTKQLYFYTNIYNNKELIYSRTVTPRKACPPQPHKLLPYSEFRPILLASHYGAL